MHLFFVEIVHFARRDALVIIQVNYFKPVVERLNSSFVFFAKHEIDEIFVAHLVWLFCFEFTGDFLEDSIYCFSGKSVAFVSAEIFFVDQEIVIGIQFPETTIQHVKMLITEVLPDFINIFFSSYSL